MKEPSKRNRLFSTREIWIQAHFAELAYKNIDPKAAHGTDAVFSSIYSFLSHCAMVSKMLVAKDQEMPPKSMIGIPNMIFVSHYDPSDNTFTFVNEDIDLDILFQDAQRIKGIADAWVQVMQSGKIKPPFG